MPRMQLTEEEARIVEDFRHKNAVRNAFNEGLDTARAVVETYAANLSSDKQFICSDISRLLQEQRK